MTVSQYDHVVPYTDLGGRGYFGVNAALVELDAQISRKFMLPSDIVGHYKQNHLSRNQISFFKEFNKSLPL